MSKLYVFLAEGFEEIEALTVVDICRRVGIEAEMVSISGERTVTGSHRITVQSDILLAAADFETVDMLVLPGGMPGTKNLEACTELLEKVKEFDRNHKKVSAICAAPSILGHLGLLEGKQACVFPGYEADLKGAAVTENKVEIDGNIITGRGMGTAMLFAIAIVEVLTDKETAEDCKQKILYS